MAMLRIMIMTTNILTGWRMKNYIPVKSLVEPRYHHQTCRLHGVASNCTAGVPAMKHGIVFTARFSRAKTTHDQ